MSVARAVDGIISPYHVPFTLLAIAAALAHYDDRVTYHRVYRAYRFYRDDATTRHLVVPCSGARRQLHFDCETARRIARHALDHQVKAQIAALERQDRAHQIEAASALKAAEQTVLEQAGLKKTATDRQPPDS